MVTSMARCLTGDSVGALRAEGRRRRRMSAGWRVGQAGKRALVSLEMPWEEWVHRAAGARVRRTTNKASLRAL